MGGTVGCAVTLSIFVMGVQPQPIRATMAQLAQALSPEEVNLRAKQIIVRIDGASIGSGTLLDHSADVYTVLSNWHVMKNSGNYIVQTIDGRKHQVDPGSIKRLPGLDLAVFQFTSNQNYQVAEIGSSTSLNEGQSVYFAGYPGELRREDNRYYRFFTANLVGVLSKSTENGYSLIYSGEAFPGMSGGPVFNKEGLMIGVHGEANVHALSGGTSNYAIPIERYQEAIAKLNVQPIAENPQPPVEKANTPEVSEVSPPPNTDIANQPEVEPTPTEEAKPIPPQASNSNNQPEESSNPDNISSVPTFTPNPNPDPPNLEVEDEPEVLIEEESPETINQPQVTIKFENPEPTDEPEVVTESKPENPEPTDEPEVVTESKPNRSESEIIDIPTTPRRIALISEKTGIDYTTLRSLLKEEKWSEADLHTYRLVEQIIKTAKQQNKHIFIELKTIAEFSCPDIRTIDYLWKKYSGNKFGFSSQQEIWQSVNQKGDFSTQTWRRFATEVGWKKGEVANSSGYLLYDQLNFEPTKAPEGHLPWWFALPDEEQKVIKYLFARCNFNPTVQELEAEARRDNPKNTAENASDAQGQESNKWLP